MENKNGQGIFYGVIGVATLVVAIIGATFAYFSASATVEGGTNVINGTTDNSLASALTASVTRVTFANSGANSDNLVPTNLDDTSTKTHIQNAITAKCVQGGYTGCHLYRIVAKSTQTINEAHLNLTSLDNDATDFADWEYVIFKGQDGAATAETGETVSFDGNATVAHGQMVQTGATGDGAFTPVDMHNGAGMTANMNYVYYLLVFLHDDNGVQNDAHGTTGTSATGTYHGTVTFTAAGGGQVTTTFSTGA